MKRLSRWIGRCMLVGAFLLFTAIFINPMRLGGEASGGKIEEGRYFVVSNGHRYTEISEIEWRIERYLEWCFFLPVVLIWMLHELGYDSRALVAQTLLARGPERLQRRVPPLVWLGFLMLAFPIGLYLPTHFVLQALFTQTG